LFECGAGSEPDLRQQRCALNLGVASALLDEKLGEDLPWILFQGDLDSLLEGKRERCGTLGALRGRLSTSRRKSGKKTKNEQRYAGSQDSHGHTLTYLSNIHPDSRSIQTWAAGYSSFKT